MRSTKKMLIGGQKMATKIPAKEFQVAVKALNKMLAKNKEDKIKIVGSKKEVVFKKFLSIVETHIDEDRSEELPDPVIDFYNTYVAKEDEEEEEAKPSEKSSKKSGKKTTKKSSKKSGKKTTKKSSKKTAKKEEKSSKKTKKTGKKKVSVVERTVYLFIEKGLETKDAIHKKLAKEYEGRNIESTISSALCILKHVKKLQG
jgi:ATPase subunit of ABC transporter with duplicated ATPase domains